MLQSYGLCARAGGCGLARRRRGQEVELAEWSESAEAVKEGTYLPLGTRHWVLYGTGALPGKMQPGGVPLELAGAERRIAERTCLLEMMKRCT